MMVDGGELEDEIARLRDLDLATLRARWRTVFRRKAPEPLPRHLLFRILAYRLQAERLGDLDQETVRLLHRIASGSGGNALSSVLDSRSRFDRLQPGSTLVREWNGARHRIEARRWGVPRFWGLVWGNLWQCSILYRPLLATKR